MYKAVTNYIYYGKIEQYICRVSPPTGVNDERRLEGESWFSMRKRTEPLRRTQRDLAEEMAAVMADALNKKYFPKQQLLTSEEENSGK